MEKAMGVAAMKPDQAPSCHVEPEMDCVQNGPCNALGFKTFWGDY